MVRDKVLHLMSINPDEIVKRFTETMNEKMNRFIIPYCLLKLTDDHRLTVKIGALRSNAELKSDEMSLPVQVGTDVDHEVLQGAGRGANLVD